MFKKILSVFAVLFSSTAFAQTFEELSITDFQYSPPAEVFVSPGAGFANNFLLQVGGKEATLGVNPLVVYSVDPNGSQPPSGWIYTVLAGSNQSIGKLFAIAGTPSNNVESGALQLAIWAVSGTMPGTIVDDLDGSFALSQQWVSAIASTQSISEYTILTNKNYGDYVTMSPIPEPTTLLMILAGLGIVFLKRNKKS